MIDLAVVMCNENTINEEDITFNEARRDDIFLNENKTLKQHTNDIIRHYLKLTKDDVMEAARMLDIGKSTIYKLLQSGELN